IAEGIKNTTVRLIILKRIDKADIRESILIRSELVQETTDKVVLIKEKLKAAGDRQKSYADNKRKPLEFEYCTDVNLHVHLEEIKIGKTLRFVEESVEIINCKVKSLKRSRILIVKSIGTQSETEDLDTYDSDCDDLSNTQAVLMANISNYGFDVISEVPHSETYLNDMENQKKPALKEQVDSLEQNFSKQIKEKERLLQTCTVFKSESKENKDKYMKNEIDLEKKIKELDNILFKVGQSAQTVHILTKPQAFYDNIHIQALGYQNPFYIKKAQRIKPTLYAGIVMSDKHVAMPMIDDEETLILKEESRSEMSEKEKDPEAIKQNISHKPIDYDKLNRLTEDFRKCFTPQQELSAEQAFWLRLFDPTSKPSDALPVKIEAPKELFK
nr:uncharacterized protein [Tanacetum cinerariifolium]